MNTYIVIASSYNGGFESGQYQAESNGEAEDLFMKEVAVSIWDGEGPIDADDFDSFDDWYENSEDRELPTLDFIIEIEGEHKANINCF